MRREGGCTQPFQSLPKALLKAIQAQNEQIIKELVKTLGPNYLRADKEGRKLIKLMGLANGRVAYWWLRAPATTNGRSKRARREAGKEARP